MSKKGPWKRLVFYPITATIWDREVQINGEVRKMFSIVISKTYKDDAGQWHDTDNLSPDDAAKAMVLIQKALDLTLFAS